MASNKDIDTFQAQNLALMLQVKAGILTIDQAIALQKAAMDEAIVSRVEKQLNMVDNK